MHSIPQVIFALLSHKTDLNLPHPLLILNSYLESFMGRFLLEMNTLGVVADGTAEFDSSYCPFFSCHF